MVFDVIVGATLEVLSNLRPSVTVLNVKVKDFLVFFLRPLVLFNVRIQVVMPTFPALFTDASRKELSDLRPILCPVFFHGLNKLVVLSI